LNTLTALVPTDVTAELVALYFFVAGVLIIPAIAGGWIVLGLVRRVRSWYADRG